MLPRPVTPVTGEALISYLTRLAHASHLTLTEVLAVLPSWFSTKISNGDDRAQHHMLIPAAPEALHALARLTGTTPASLARALPAFVAADPHSPVRATTACRRCAARHGILEHPGFGGDSILPRCSGLGGRCLPRYRRLAEPRSDHFAAFVYRTSVQLRCPAAPPGGRAPPARPPPAGPGHLLVGHPGLRRGFPGLVKGDAQRHRPRRRRRP